MTTGFPSLAEVCAHVNDLKAIKVLVRELLNSAAAWPVADEPAPAEMLADLRHAITVAELGDGIISQALRLLNRLSPIESRN